jgi:hypothetical protein
MKVEKDQDSVCLKYGAIPIYCPPDLKIGISPDTRNKKIFPVNGLRHPPEADTTGWFIWAGEEYSDDPDFFVPLHVEHLIDWRPEILKYLALPPGYRFLLGEHGYEDVWFDENLLNV